MGAPGSQSSNEVVALLPAGSDYTITNDTEDRTFDADTVAVAELADIVATLINDLAAVGIVTTA